MLLSLQELQTGCELGLIYGIVAAGIFVALRMIQVTDMTCDGSFMLGCTVLATALEGGTNVGFAMVLAALAGALAGLCTGVLSIKCKIGDLFSGIIVAFALYSINLRIMGGAPNITLKDDSIFEANFFALCITVLAQSLLLVCVLSSGFGLKMRAVGHNKLFAPVYGINVNRMIVTGLMLSNGLIALGGGLFCQYQGFCDISQGVGTLVAGLASVVIGERIFPFKNQAWRVLSSVAGAVIYRVIIGIALHCDVLGIKAQDLNIVTSALVVLAMIVRRNRGC